MNTLRKSILIGLAVIGLGSAPFAAQAQTGAPAEGRHGLAARMETMHANMTEHFAKHQAKLHDLLKLTSAQEGAWTSYQTAIAPPAPPAHEDWAALSAPARMEKAIAMAKTHTARMESELTALNTFYAVLSADQKKVFDANTLGGAHGGRGGHGMRMWQHG